MVLGKWCSYAALSLAIPFVSTTVFGQGDAIAQITPDQSLGPESSILRPDVLTEQGRIDRIDGGAIRGDNLFHSFSDFNVGNGQRVYFANPTVINTIVSRVTGSDPSSILGTLGILGNADLLFVNPHGIVFGRNAVLDINGSLLLSTAEEVPFDAGYAFSATAANAPPTLSINAPIMGLDSWLPPASGEIQTASPLSLAGNLSLLAADIDIGSDLMAQGDIDVMATDRLSIRDRATLPVRLLAANGIRLQGDRALQISALSHPLSEIAAGDALTLRSGAPIVADALFRAGDTIRVENLAGGLGRLISDGDPVFQTTGDFTAESYTGASLQILAGGSVTIPGTVSIDSAGAPFNDGTVELSDGTSLTLQGTTEPTVDIRAGTTEFFGTPSQEGNPTSADITIGSIVNPTGTVYLTNRFQPNSDLSGNITVGEISTVDSTGGGDVVLDSQGQITAEQIDASGGDRNALFFDFDFDAIGGDGGDIKLLATDAINLPFPSLLFSSGLRGGAITLRSDTAITQENGPFGADFSELSFIESISTGDRRGGNVILSAPTLTLGGNVFSDTYGAGRSGNLLITGDTLTTNQASLNTDTFGSGDAGTVRVNVDTIDVGVASLLGSVSFSDSGGNGGDVIVQADSITATEGGQIGSLANFLGDAGDVTVTANTITLSGFLPAELSEDIFSGSAIFSSVSRDVEGNSGMVTLNTGTLRVEEGASVTTSSFGIGDAGAIEINASDRVEVDGAVFADFAGRSQPSSIASEIFTGAIGEGGQISIRTPTLSLTNGGTITTLSDGDGSAGNINLTITDTILVDGVVSFAEAEAEDRVSRISVITESEATGEAGKLIIQAPSLVLANGGQLTAESRGLMADNQGGDILLGISDVISMTGGSRISATAGTSGAGGNGGNIDIDATFVTAEANGNNDITANAFDGQGGSVNITAVGILGLTARSRSELESLLGTTDPVQLDPVNLSSSDITAISQANPRLNGVVVLRSPDVDPSRDAVDLPSDVVDASRLIAQGCAADGVLADELGGLIITGRGGLPQTPGDRLGFQPLVLDWDTFEVAEFETSIEDSGGDRGGDRPLSQASASQRSKQPSPLVEVQALTRRADGKVILTAENIGGNWPHNNPLETCVGTVP